MNLRYDQLIAAIILGLSLVSLFLWVQVNQSGPLGHSMTAAFGSKPETLPDPPKSSAPLHSKRSLAGYRTSLGLAGVSVAYLYLAD
jgi:hypothetical protein